MDYFVAFLVYVVTLISIIYLSKQNKRLLIALFLSLLIRYALLVTDLYLFPGLPFLESADSRRFQGLALRLMETDRETLLSTSLPGGSALYVYWLALLYTLIGETNVLVPRTINIFAGILTVYHGYKISELLWGKRAAAQNALLLAFIPMLAIYSQNNMREAFVAFFLIAGVRYYLLWYFEKKISSILFAVVCLLVGTAFHFGTLMALLGLFIYKLLISVKQLFRGQLRSFYQTVLLLIVLSSGILYLNATGWGLSTIGGEGAITEFGVEDLIEMRGDGERRSGRAAYLVGLSAENSIDVIWQTPVRAFYFLLTPFPWMITSAWDIIGIIDALLYFILIWGIYKSWPLIKANPARMALFVMLAATVVAFAWGVTNYGTAMRHRAKLVVLIVALSGHIGMFRRIVYHRKLKRYVILFRRK